MKLSLRRITVSSPDAQNAIRTWPERQSLLVRLADQTGIVGVGEASPLPGYSPDTLDAAEAALSAVDPLRLAKALSASSTIEALRQCGRLVSDGVPSARMALETAALDWLGQLHERSAPSLLGARDGSSRLLAQLIGLAAAPDCPTLAEQALVAGFRYLKLKLGARDALPQELEGVRALRRRLGPNVGLRLDANGCLSAPEIELAWRTLAPLQIELFEEPGDVASLVEHALPLGLDESLQGLSPTAVSELLRKSGARAVVLKPMALGGIAHCLELAERALAAGAGVVISHCFDGPFAWRAASALALALPEGLAHGLAPHQGLRSWSDDPTPVDQGSLRGWSAAGLGLAPSQAFA